MFLIIHLALLTVSSGFNFEIINPALNSQIIAGSQMPIEWILHNVTLPLKDVSVKIDLLQVFPIESFFISVAQGIPNSGKFIWSMPSDLINLDTVFKMRISSDSTTTNTFPFTSLQFSIQQESSYKARSLVMVEPLKNAELYPGQKLMIKWTKGADFPYFPWGVHVEVREPYGKALLTIQRNVSLTLDKSGQISWTVPDEPFVKISEQVFYGRLFIWGYDANRKSLTHADNGGIRIDYSDRLILQLSFTTPNSQDVFTVGTKARMIFEMLEEKSRKPVKGRSMTISMFLEDELERRVAQIFDSLIIEESSWNGGSIILNWNVPSADDLHASRNILTEKTFAILTPSKYRIKYYASYKAKAPGKYIDIWGQTEFFTISFEKTGDRPSGDEYSRFSCYSYMSIIFFAFSMFV